MDDTLRTLSRAPAGDLDARGAQLRAWLRSGRLDPERLRVAGELGDFAAGALAQVEALVLPDEPRAWVRLAERWGSSVVVRSVVVAVRAGLPTPNDQDRLAVARVDEARVKLEAVEAWCDGPTLGLAEAAREAAGPEPVWTGWNLLAAPVYAGHLPWLIEQDATPDGSAVAEAAVRSLIGITLRTLVETGVDGAPLCRAMQAGLLEWALRPRS